MKSKPSPEDGQVRARFTDLRNWAAAKKAYIIAAVVVLLGTGAVVASLASSSEVPASSLQDELRQERDDDTQDIPAAMDAHEPTEEIVADYVLESYRGTVYAMKKPAAWQATDNLNAIEAADPNDPLTGVSGTVIMGAFGEQTPEGHIQNVLGMIGATDVVVEHSSDQERVQERWTGLDWVVRTQTLTYTDAGGHRVKAKATAGVLQGSGQYVAMISAFQTTPEKWSRWAQALERMMQTIQIIDGSRVGGHDKVRLPTAADVRSDSSPMMDSWRYRNESGDRSAQGFSDATLGQESGLASPSTGTEYTLPLSSYDPTVGGYRNPDNTSEILVDTY